MKHSILLFLAGMVSITMIAQVPNMAQVNKHDASLDDKLVIAHLERIQLLVNNQHQIQSVFVFEDQTSMTFDNVAVITFLTEQESVEIDHKSDPATSVETIGEQMISVYPNPTSDILYISGLEENHHGAVISINGQHMCDINSRHTSIDVSGWPDGTYLIRIDNQIFKLIKQ